MGNLGKIIVATGFEKLPKVQYIAQSSHTVSIALTHRQIRFLFIFVYPWLSWTVVGTCKKDWQFPRDEKIKHWINFHTKGR